MLIKYEQLLFYFIAGKSVQWVDDKQRHSSWSHH